MKAWSKVWDLHRCILDLETDQCWRKENNWRCKDRCRPDYWPPAIMSRYGARFLFLRLECKLHSIPYIIKPIRIVSHDVCVGCSTAVEHTPSNLEVVDSNPAECWAFSPSFDFFSLSLPITRGVSLIRSLKEELLLLCVVEEIEAKQAELTDSKN